MTAEDVLGPPNLSQVLRPDSPGTTALERAWHFLLGAINSGYMYYGKALDMELKPVVASNEAIAWAKKALPQEFADKTPPTVFLPQHWPDNPGGTNFGPPYKYKVTEMPTDTFFWTFAYDVSGIAGATLRYRLDKDGENPLWDDTNETYKGGDGVRPWKSLPMFRRDFPKGNVTGDPEFDTSILPQEIAELFWVRLTGLENVLIDWYVEVSDKKGNITRTEIQHLYIGSVSLGSVIWEPAYPDCDDVITVNHEKPGLLHWGINGWKMPPETLWPIGTTPFGDDKSVETPMTRCSKGYCVSLGPVFDLAYQVDFVFHHHDGTWDNNGGKDWHILFSPCMQEFAGTDSNEAGGTMPFETQSAGESVSGEVVGEGMGLVGETEAEIGVFQSSEDTVFRDYGDSSVVARVLDNGHAERRMARMGGGCSVGSQRPRSFWLMWVCGLLVGVRLRGRCLEGCGAKRRNNSCCFEDGYAV